ncbi:hypothetical protein C8Q73DRAFT_666292 [Cubamyces lactineus]|nr:hypothetical protein C8Q73DRAFT_666292 [Cubamyces lactineus]
MSASPLDPALVATISSTLLDNRVSLASIILPLYDFLITFDQEVRCIWAPITRAQFSAEIIQYVAWAAFPALRVLALSGMNWKLAVPIFILACGPFVINLWTLIGVGTFGVNVPLVGCIGSTNQTDFEARLGVCVSRSCAILADVLVIAATWWYTARGGTFRTTIRVGGFRQPLARVMVLHGMIYFLAHLILNALHLILTLLSDFAPVQPISLVTLFTDPLSAMLICRFLLALQSAHMQTTSSDPSNLTLNDNWQHGTDTGLEVGTLRFATVVVGPMGGSIGGYSSEGSTLRGDDSEEMRTIASR